jgi:hypothetical protein
VWMPRPNLHRIVICISAVETVHPCTAPSAVKPKDRSGPLTRKLWGQNVEEMCRHQPVQMMVPVRTPKKRSSKNRNKLFDRAFLYRDRTNIFHRIIRKPSSVIGTSVYPGYAVEPIAAPPHCYSPSPLSFAPSFNRDCIILSLLSSRANRRAGRFP